MRLTKYINEAQQGIIMKFDPYLLKRECADYIRKDSKFPNEPFLRIISSIHVRNMKDDSNFLPMIKLQSYIDSGRRPLDMSARNHREFNELFNKKFGWNVRDGVFVRRENKMAHTNVIMPCGIIKYVWSKTISDLFDESSTHMSEEERKRLVDKYIDTNISEAYTQEVSFDCKDYYCINFRDNDELDEFKKQMGG